MRRQSQGRGRFDWLTPPPTYYWNLHLLTCCEYLEVIQGKFYNRIHHLYLLLWFLILVFSLLVGRGRSRSVRGRNVHCSERHDLLAGEMFADMACRTGFLVLMAQSRERLV